MGLQEQRLGAEKIAIVIVDCEDTFVKGQFHHKRASTLFAAALALAHCLLPSSVQADCGVDLKSTQESLAKKVGEYESAHKSADGLVTNYNTGFKDYTDMKKTLDPMKADLASKKAALQRASNDTSNKPAVRARITRELQSQVDKLQQSVDQLQPQVDALKKKNDETNAALQKSLQPLQEKQNSEATVGLAVLACDESAAAHGEEPYGGLSSAKQLGKFSQFSTSIDPKTGQLSLVETPIDPQKMIAEPKGDSITDKDRALYSNSINQFMGGKTPAVKTIDSVQNVPTGATTTDGKPIPAESKLVTVTDPLGGNSGYLVDSQGKVLPGTTQLNAYEIIRMIPLKAGESTQSQPVVSGPAPVQAPVTKVIAPIIEGEDGKNGNVVTLPPVQLKSQELPSKPPDPSNPNEDIGYDEDGHPLPKDPAQRSQTSTPPNTQAGNPSGSTPPTQSRDQMLSQLNQSSQTLQKLYGDPDYGSYGTKVKADADRLSEQIRVLRIQLGIDQPNSSSGTSNHGNAGELNPFEKPRE